MHGKSPFISSEQFISTITRKSNCDLFPGKTAEKRGRQNRGITERPAIELQNASEYIEIFRINDLMVEFERTCRAFPDKFETAFRLFAFIVGRIIEPDGKTFERLRAFHFGCCGRDNCGIESSGKKNSERNIGNHSFPDRVCHEIPQFFRRFGE